MSSRFHRSIATAEPMAMNVSRPTILQLIVRARLTPVASIHAHQRSENSLCAQSLSVHADPGLGAGGTGRKSSLVALLVEANVAIETVDHEETECGIEQNQAVLRDVCVV